MLPLDRTRATIAVLISDGRPTRGTVDASEIITRFTAMNRGEISVYCVSAGKRVNHFLLDMLAYLNRGAHTSSVRVVDLPVMLGDLSRAIARPVLINLTATVSSSLREAVFPRALENLYLDKALVLWGRAPKDLSTFTLRVKGESARGVCDTVFAVDLGGARLAGSELKQQWISQRIWYDLSLYLQSRDRRLLEDLKEAARAAGITLPYEVERL